MSLWSTITDRVKGIFNKMFGKSTIEEVLHITPAISDKMFNAINLWTKMYEGNAPWLKAPTEEDPSCVKSLGLPQLIACEKTRTALIEFESEITTPIKDIKPATPNYMDNRNIGTDGKPQPMIANHVIPEDVPKGSTDRAEFLNNQYAKLKDALRVQIEYGIAKGGLVIKPYPVKHNIDIQQTNMLTGKVIQKDTTNPWTIEFDYIQASDFYPLAFDASGKITEAAFVERKMDKGIVYSRVEYHKLTETGITVINKAFKTKVVDGRADQDYLGEEIKLSEVPEWAGFSEETTVAGVNRLLFAYFKMPEANTIDTHSPLGVSGFDKVKGLIEEADKQYSRMLWEFEGGELAIDIDRQALRWLEDPDNPDKGHSVMGTLQQRLYRKVDLNEDNTYNVFSPALRDQSLINGLNCLLMRIEDGAGISRGTLSDVTTEAKTATELRMLRIRSYETNAHIQKAIQHALEDAIYVMNAYCDLYDITPDGEYEVSYEWDDSIINDSDTELTKRMILVQNGIASKLETRMWYFGETENQAREALRRVQVESMESVEQNIAEMQMMGQPPESKKEESPKDQNKNSNTNSANNFKSGDNQYSE
jgi:A118 family predicted phage portal protein